MSEKALLELPDLLALLPHRPPFLFVDRVLTLDPFKSIVAERKLRPEEPFFAGHFPGQPLMPGVLVAEALAQASGLLLGLSARPSAASHARRPAMYYLASTNLKYKQPARPGDVLLLTARHDTSLGGLFHFLVNATAGDKLIASGALTLVQAGN